MELSLEKENANKNFAWKVSITTTANLNLISASTQLPTFDQYKKSYKWAKYKWLKFMKNLLELAQTKTEIKIHSQQYTYV